MSHDFTAYVRSLDSEGAPLSPEVFERTLGKLRGALIHEMKKRGIWNVPPPFLGIYGSSHWAEGDALEDLLLHCYQYIFIQRLAALRRQLSVRPNIEGLVYLNIRHFLHEAQRRHDPLGMRLFEITCAAVQQLCDDGTLFILDGGPRLRNNTVLGFAEWLDPRLAADVDLKVQAAAWCDALLPDLVIAWVKEPVIESLAAQLVRLEENVEVFKLENILQPLKNEVRARWWAGGLWGTAPEILRSDNEDEDWLAIVRPENTFEDHQNFNTLLQCIGERLGRLDEKEKTKDYLRRLWLALREWAAEAHVEQEPSLANDKELPDSAALPDNKSLGQILSIPRARIPGLKETLGELLNQCRGLAPSDAQRPSPESLRATTGSKAAQACRSAADTGPIRVGDVFLLKSSSLPTEWLLVEWDTNRGGWAVPVDGMPLLGREDCAAVMIAGSDEKTSVRCSLGVWVDPSSFKVEQRIGHLTHESLALVQRRRQEPATSIENADDDPEYKEWIAMIRDASGAISTAAKPSTIRPRAKNTGWRSALALAAVFVIAALAFGWWNWSLQQNLAEPIVITAAGTKTVRFGGPQRDPEIFRPPAEDRYIAIRASMFRNPPEVESYRLRIFEAGDGRGDPVWESGWQTDDREIVAALRRDQLKVREYVLRLVGRDSLDREIWSEELEIEIDWTDP